MVPPRPNPPHCRLSTSLTILLAATSVQVLWPMYAGVEASEEAARGLSSPPLRVDSGAAMLRATRPGGGRRGNLDLVLRRSGWLGLLSQRPG